MKASVLLLPALLLTSCISEYFTVNESTPQVLYGKIMSDIDSVEVIRQTTLRVHSGGVAALRNYDITQCRWEFMAKLTKGTETRYRVRTLPIGRRLLPSVDIVYSTSGCRVEEEGKLLVRNDTVRAVPNAEEKIQVTNDGDFLTVMIGCTEVFRKPVARPATEWLVVESPSGSEVVLTQISTEETR